MNPLDDSAPQLPTIIDQSASASPSAMNAPTTGAENYVLGAEIARGGMGAILEAEDTKLRRTVAAKLMLFDTDADPEMQQRFLREAEVLAQLAHPNIVPVYDIVREGGAPLFYTMKRINGRTLQAIINDLRKGDAAVMRHFTFDRLLLAFRKVCDALAFAHSKGIIHRDLKPENVMIGEFGEVLVMDWGIAKRLKEEGEGRKEQGNVAPASFAFRPSPSAFSATLQGAVMGTPQYMSPEQARGEIDALDARSDIFSLGGILYAILTLRPPVEGATLEEVLKKVIAAQITSPSDYQAGTAAKGPAMKKGDVLEAKLIKPLPHAPSGRVPAALSAVAMKALRLDKAQRYQSVAELSADLEAYQTGFATKAEEAGLAKQLVLLIRRNKGIFTTAAAAWLIVTVLAGWFVWNLRASERETRRQAQIAKANEQTAVQQKEAARRALAKSQLNLAESALREGDGVAMQAALNDVPEDLRDSTWNYLVAQSDTSFAHFFQGENQPGGVAVHPTQPGVFVFARDHMGGRTPLQAVVMNVRTGERLLEFAPDFPTPNKNAGFRVAFSPDGERIAVGAGSDGSGIAIHSARDGKKLLSWAAPHTFGLEFSPDGTLLLQSLTANRPAQLWDASSGQLVRAYEPSEKTAPDNLAAFTLDGQQLLTAGGSAGARLVNARDGTLVRALKGARNASAIAIGAKGTAAVADDKGFVTVYELSSGNVLAQFRVHQAAFSKITFTPSGEQLATAFNRADGRQAIEVWQAATGERLRSLLGGTGEVVGMSLHPVSGEFVVASKNTTAWDLTGTRARWQIAKAASPTGTAFWGADDLLFAWRGTPGAHLVKLEGDTPRNVWKSDAAPATRQNVSADGRMAALYLSGNSPACLVVRHDGEKVERVGTVPLPKEMTSYGFGFLRLSPSGHRLATSSVGDATLVFEPKILNR